MLCVHITNKHFTQHSTTARFDVANTLAFARDKLNSTSTRLSHHQQTDTTPKLKKIAITHDKYAFLHLLHNPQNTPIHITSKHEAHTHNPKCINDFSFSSRLFVCVYVSLYLCRVLVACPNSATEGADSAPVSGAGTPSEEKVGQVGMGECRLGWIACCSNTI